MPIQIKSVIRDFIEADRVDVYTEFTDLLLEKQKLEAGTMSFLTDANLLVFILESADGWNILLQELPNILKMAKSQIAVAYFGKAALRSADIAHYMLLKKFPEFEKFEGTTNVSIKEILNNAPLNLAYYLRNQPGLFKDMMTGILTKEFWMRFQMMTINPSILEFCQLLVEHALPRQLEKIASANIGYTKHTGVFLRILARSPRVTPEFLKRTVVEVFCYGQVYPTVAYKTKLARLGHFKTISRRLDKFQVLEDSLGLDLSDYIAADVLKVANWSLLEH